MEQSKAVVKTPTNFLGLFDSNWQTIGVTVWVWSYTNLDATWNHVARKSVTWPMTSTETNDPRMPLTFIVFIAIGSAMPRDVDGTWGLEAKGRMGDSQSKWLQFGRSIKWTIETHMQGITPPCLTKTITSKCEDINQPTRVMESSKVCGKQKCQAEIKMLAKFWKPMKFLSGLFLPASGGQPRYASYFRLPQKWNESVWRLSTVPCELLIS